MSRTHDFILDRKALLELRRNHQLTKSKRKSYRLNALILLGQGWTYQEVSNALLLDEKTLMSYVGRYREKIPGKFNQNAQDKFLRKYRKLRKKEGEDAVFLFADGTQPQHNPLVTCGWIKKGEDKPLLSNPQYHRLNILGAVDIDTYKLVYQFNDGLNKETAVDFLEKIRKNYPQLFIDAVHPEHNTMASYGWIKRGETRQLKTNSGRERLNLHGAINAETHEVTIIESDTVNEESTIDLLETIRQKYFMVAMIYIILDNAKYHYSRKVQAYLEGKNIKLVFLPSYSPNLNLIERLWKFFKKKVLYNRYHENITAFRQACIKFFRNIDQYDEEIANFMDAEFHIA